LERSAVTSNAVKALSAARTVGLTITGEGDSLLLEAAAPPSNAVLGLLSSNKAAILALLRSREGWSVDDWLFFFDERAAIAEFDGGLTRSEAEALALSCLVKEVTRSSASSASSAARNAACFSS
jgi:hypothetical protein